MKSYLVIGIRAGKKSILRECQTKEVAEMVINTNWCKYDDLEIEEIEFSNVECY